VLQVVDGSPAALAGVQAGDRILDVDGTTVTESPTSSAS
jgi:C-terminal processing protease CtpA/Prc